MIPKKVSRDVIKDPITKKKRKLTYRDVEYDFDGWVDVRKFFPADFDIVELKTKGKTYAGWAFGRNWDGLKINSDMEILYWKRKD